LTVGSVVFRTAIDTGRRVIETEGPEDRHVAYQYGPDGRLAQVALRVVQGDGAIPGITASLQEPGAIQHRAAQLRLRSRGGLRLVGRGRVDDHALPS
jgi:hypothetical protein